MLSSYINKLTNKAKRFITRGTLGFKIYKSQLSKVKSAIVQVITIIKTLIILLLHKIKLLMHNCNNKLINFDISIKFICQK